MRTVPVLITADVDPSPEVSVSDKRKSLELTTGLLDEFGIRATFFSVARTAQEIGPAVKVLKRHKHEVGCHGLTHGFEEEYTRMSEQQQREYLVAATRILEDLVGEKIVSFRGPRVKTSRVTQGVLEELGYWADSSVCSQRVDFISSNLINWGWITAPRLPYRPSVSSPYRKGERNLWVIPVSALVLPFVSGIINTFGINYAKVLFNILYRESMATGKPIVYLFHPVEFVPKTLSVERRFSWNNVLVEGLRIRRSKWLYLRDIKKRFGLHRTLFEHMKTFSGVRFCTMKDYIREYQTGDEC